MVCSNCTKLNVCTVHLNLQFPLGCTDFREPQYLYIIAIPVHTLWAPTGCSEPQCLYIRAKQLLILWTIIPVDGTRSSTIQLQFYTLWAVRPLENLRASKIQLSLYTPYLTYSLYRASVVVHRAIILLPLSAVRNLLTLSAWTVEL